MRTSSVLFVIFLIFTNSLPLQHRKLDSYRQRVEIESISLEFFSGAPSKEKLEAIYAKVEKLLEEAKLQQTRHNQMYIENEKQCKKEQAQKQALIDTDSSSIETAENTKVECEKTLAEINEVKEGINKKIEKLNEYIAQLDKAINDESGMKELNIDFKAILEKLIEMIKQKVTGTSFVQFDFLDRAKNFVNEGVENGKASQSETFSIGGLNLKGDLGYQNGKLTGSLSLFGDEQQQPQQPVVQQPIVQQPVVQEPIVQQPVVQQPVVQQPVVQQIVQQPIVQQPIVQQPVVQQPIVQQPQQPVVQQPIVQQPIVQQPVVQQPIVQQPIVQQPIVQQQIAQQQIAQPQAPVQQQVIQPQIPIETQIPVVQQPIVQQQIAQQPIVQQPVEQIEEKTEEIEEESKTVFEKLIEILKALLIDLNLYKMGLMSHDNIKEKLIKLKTSFEESKLQLEDELQPLLEQEKLALECVNSQDKIIDEAAVHVESNQQLHDTSVKICREFGEDFVKHGEQRAANVHALGELLKYIKEKMEILPENVLQKYQEAVEYFKNNQDKVIHVNKYFQ